MVVRHWYQWLIIWVWWRRASHCVIYRLAFDSTIGCRDKGGIIAGSQLTIVQVRHAYSHTIQLPGVPLLLETFCCRLTWKTLIIIDWEQGTLAFFVKNLAWKCAIKLLTKVEIPLNLLGVYIFARATIQVITVYSSKESIRIF